jgi:hypothetical protein
VQDSLALVAVVGESEARKELDQRWSERERAQSGLAPKKEMQ